MNVKVISVQKVVTKDGTILYRVFAALSDGSVGNFWSTEEFKLGDTVALTVSINKDCKFIVRPVVNR